MLREMLIMGNNNNNNNDKKSGDNDVRSDKSKEKRRFASFSINLCHELDFIVDFIN